MKGITKAILDSCVGCNRCVRKCPVELANTTYQNSDGDIKVDIDKNMCISCGRCVSACDHNSRIYEDDTERFFDDLSSGIPVSVIVAPSIRTNILEYKRLFAYLRKLGVKLIYDVSLGADICIWGHIRYVEQEMSKGSNKISLIAEPCPVIVSYCEIYKPTLLDKLSPVHSPMACISIYMKKYKNINHRIAAISPCIAKSDEFQSTGLIDYNVTFKNLLEFIGENNIKLPEEEVDYDSYDCEIGSLFPKPGGLKECIELYFGKELYILSSEGFDVFDELDSYAKTNEEILPDIFDVLNCANGCNMGTACSDNTDYFEINFAMNKKHKRGSQEYKDEFLEKLCDFDNELNMPDFTREYRKTLVLRPKITDNDIEKAFKTLGKDSFEKRNYNCGACGSDTCYSMARKIALGVNIPINCIVKNMEGVKSEHEENLAVNEKLLELSSQLESALEQANTANKTKSEFLATMSHEIRTPLNAILGITEIQLIDNTLSESTKSALYKIYNSGDMLLGLINDILDLSKIESGKLELIIDKYEIASLISDTAQINVLRIGSKNIVFDLEIDENLPVNLSGDELRVKQVLNNILSNAFKYTDEGNVTFSVGTVATGCPETNGAVVPENEITLVFTVKDTGQGMTPDQLEKLFDEYSRFNLEANRSTEGAGLGMNITNNLINMMNGKIEIESEFGTGSTVTVYIPQGRVDDKLLGREMVENLLKFRSGNYAQITRSQITREPMPYGSVLIVDDVETNIYVATGLLLPYKLKVDSCDSGFGAIEKIKEGNVYDIIFMDHMMPKMDGMETTRIIREMGYSEPIIALTANAVVGQMQIFLENGFNDFISKPIDVRQMNVVLNKFIRDKQPPEVIEQARKQAEFDAQNAIEDDIPDMISKYTEFFLRDAFKTLDVLEEFLEKGEPYSEQDMQNYVIFTHGIKSALANIGRNELSNEAKNLEMMGKDRNIEVILANTKPFLEALRAVAMELMPKDDEDDDSVDEDPGYLREKLQDLAAACDEYDQATAETLLAVLNERTWSKETRVLLGKVNESLFTCEFESVVEVINEFLEN